MFTFQVLLFAVFFSQTTISQNITQSIGSLSDELKSLFCDGLSVGSDKCNDQSYGIQDFINSFTDYFQDDEQDISTITKQIIDNLNQKLNLRASFLTNMSSKIQSSCEIYGCVDDCSSQEAIPDFDTLKFSGNADRSANLPNDMTYNSVYGDVISLSSSTYKLPNNVDYEDDNVQTDARVWFLFFMLFEYLIFKNIINNNKYLF